MYLRAEHNEMNETNLAGFGRRGGPSQYSIPTYAEYYEINEEEANRDRAEAYETFYGSNNAESNENSEEWRSSDHRHGPYTSGNVESGRYWWYGDHENPYIEEQRHVETQVVTLLSELHHDVVLSIPRGDPRVQISWNVSSSLDFVRDRIEHLTNIVDINVTRNETNSTVSWVVSFESHVGDLPEMISHDEEFVNVVTLLDGSGLEQHLKGGVCACSSKDLVHWRNEGVMIHYSNISDPFGMFPSKLNHPLRAQRPKVLPNHETNRFVMWMQIDTRGNENETLAAAAVATSFYPNGPFILTRSSFPDNDHTHDQTVFQDKDGIAYVFFLSFYFFCLFFDVSLTSLNHLLNYTHAHTNRYLARTYYATVEYLLPEAQMQPIWESVKKDVNSEVVDFGLNYHRAFYHPMYDTYHDNYLQSWRLETEPWLVAYQDKAGRNHWTEQLEKVNDVFVPSLRRFERGFDGEIFFFYTYILHSTHTHKYV